MMGDALFSLRMVIVAFGHLLINSGNSSFFSSFRFTQKYFTNLCIFFSTWGPPVIRVKNILWAKQVVFRESKKRPLGADAWLKEGLTLL
jgi:hypothetical protein